MLGRVATSARCLPLAPRSLLASSRRFSSGITHAQLPVVDISAFLTAHRAPEAASSADLAAADNVISEVLDACSSWGFFYISGHGLAQSHFDQVFGEAQKFFSEGGQIKPLLHTKNNEGVRGYSGLFEQGNYGVDATDARALGDAGEEDDSYMDAKEVYHVGQELPPSHPHYHSTLFAPNVYPSPAMLETCPAAAGLQRALEQHWSAMMTLSDAVFCIFARCMRLHPHYFAPLADEGMNSMNVIHYPPLLRESERQLGIGEHTDFECFTLLAQQRDGPSALEVLSPLTGQWERIGPPPSGSELVVNVGDMMARWSNDLFKSTVHRAINDPTRHRQSIAFFRCCNADTVISNLIEAQPDKYPPVVAGQHMLGRIEAANDASNVGS